MGSEEERGSGGGAVRARGRVVTGIRGIVWGVAST